MKTDNKILRYLYSKKNNNIFYDVSDIFNVSNRQNFYNEVENPNIKPNESISKSKNRFGLYNKLLNKDQIDEIVVSLEKNGYVEKKVEGYLSPSAISIHDDPADANNSVCMITPKGIEYYENYKNRRSTKVTSIIALSISLFSLIVSITIFFYNY